MMFRMWRPKNVFEAILPIQLITWLFGFGIIHYPLKNPRIGLTILYTILAISVFIISLNYVFPFFLNANLVNAQQKLLSVILSVNIFIYFSDIILMWYWRNQLKSIELRAEEIDETLKKLGVPLEYSSIFIDSVKVAIFWIIAVLFINIVNIIGISDDFDVLTNIILIFTLQHSIHANTIPTMQFWISIELMERRFKKINQVLLDIIDGEKNGQGVNVNYNWPPTPILIRNRDESFHRLRRPQDNTKDILRITKHVHLELTVLCHEISQIFGIQITMALASAIVTVTCFIGGFYIGGFGSTHHILSILYRLLLLTVRLGNNCTKVYFINSCCAKAIIEWEKTGRIIHELEIAARSSVYRDEIRQFSLQMMQNPVSFTACGFVTLGYEFLRGFVGSVTTYVIILVQLYGPPTS